jgi:hypothetical protein
MFRSSISIFGIRTPRPEHDVESAAPVETAQPVRTFSTFPVESAPPVPTLNVENTPQQSQSRFGRFSINARTIVGSSVYSQSPGQPRWKTPKMPAMSWGRRPAHERHHPASLAALALPVVRAVLVPPLPPLVPSWPAIDLICDLLDLGVDEGILRLLSGQRDIGRVTSIGQFWCASVRLLWCAEGVLKSR